MLAMTVSSIAAIVQLGFIIGVGLLLDTFPGAHHHRAGAGGDAGGEELVAVGGAERPEEAHPACSNGAARASTQVTAPLSGSPVSIMSPTTTILPTLTTALLSPRPRWSARPGDRRQSGKPPRIAARWSHSMDEDEVVHIVGGTLALSLPSCPRGAERCRCRNLFRPRRSRGVGKSAADQPPPTTRRVEEICATPPGCAVRRSRRCRSAWRCRCFTGTAEYRSVLPFVDLDDAAAGPGCRASTVVVEHGGQSGERTRG